MLSHFLRAWADSRKQIQCPAGVRGRGDPAGAKGAEEAPRNARAWSGNQQTSLTAKRLKTITMEEINGLMILQVEWPIQKRRFY
jgi:hypothetical protein